MRAASQILTLTACWSILSSPDAVALGVDFFSEEPPRAKLAEDSEKIIQAHWRELEKVTGHSPDLTRIPVRIISSGKMNGPWAKTEREGITLSSAIPAGNFAQVLRHEVSHAFFLHSCPAITTHHQMIHETFSLWAGKDYHRFLATNAFLSASDALNWFRKYDWNKKIDSRKTEMALSRILSQTDEKVLQSFYTGLMKSCRDGSLNINEANATLAGILRFSPDYAFRTTAVDFLLIDGLSGETVSQEGNIRGRFYPASTLKTVMVALFPELITHRTSRNNDQWKCPVEEKIRSWSWKEALAKSCNGFFLDAEKLDYRKWTELSGKLGHPSAIHSHAEAIGLIPTMKLSLAEIVKLYQWVDLSYPEITDVLKETSVTGTLAHLPASSWFTQRGIMLKSGTQRDGAGRPVDAWIVAVGPRAVDGQPQFFSVIHSRGSSTRHLLDELKKRLTGKLDGNRAVRVNLLALVPDNQVKVSCREGMPLMKKTGGKWSFSADTHDGEFRCLGGPLVLTFPARKGKISRDYFGVLEIGRNENRKASSKLHSEKQARARSQSPYTLRTSLRTYLKGVVASEFPRGNLETLKALTAVAMNNILHFEKRGEVICDNTVCQVFNVEDRLPPATGRKITLAVDEVLRRPHPLDGRDWVFFSLGGDEPWKELRKVSFVTKQFAAPVVNLRKISGEVEVLTHETRRYGCDFFSAQLKLPSCPEKISFQNNQWIFEGKGRGHGKGLDLIRANAEAAQGKPYLEVLKSGLNL